MFATLLGNKIHMITYALNLLVKNTISLRLTRWLLLMQEHDVHLKHVDSTINLFADALPITPHLDDIVAYDYDNKIPCTKFFSLWMMKHQLQNYISFYV